MRLWLGADVLEFQWPLPSVNIEIQYEELDEVRSTTYPDASRNLIDLYVGGVRRLRLVGFDRSEEILAHIESKLPNKDIVTRSTREQTFELYPGLGAWSLALSISALMGGVELAYQDLSHHTFLGCVVAVYVLSVITVLATGSWSGRMKRSEQVGWVVSILLMIVLFILHLLMISLEQEFVLPSMRR